MIYLLKKIIFKFILSIIIWVYGYPDFMLFLGELIPQDVMDIELNFLKEQREMTDADYK